MVSTRVVKTVIFSGCPATAKSTCAPSLRPIQLRCMVRTFSGQPSMVSRPLRSSSAYAVMRRNHWVRSRCSTRVLFVTPAAAVDDLLVGEDGGAVGAPVDFGLFAVREAGLEHPEEEPLVPAVVVGQAGGDLGGPVVAEAHAAHLLAHVGDVGERPLARGDVVFEGGVFGGETEGVPAHGVEDVRAAHPHEAGEGVADGVVADVAHVQRRRRGRAASRGSSTWASRRCGARRRRGWGRRPSGPAIWVRFRRGCSGRGRPGCDRSRRGNRLWTART